MNNRIGLTGSTGSLGKVILNNKKKLKIECFKGDITNYSEVENWVKKKRLNILIHLAAIVPIKTVNKNKKKAKLVNFIGTKNLVDACVDHNISWFFFSSTSHVYKSSEKKIKEDATKQPISYYGKTKLMAENYIVKKFKNSKTNFCIGRIFSTTNINQKKNYLVPDLKFKIKNCKKKITLKNLNHYRDFISMDDLSNIIFKLMKIKFNGIINLATGNGVLLKEIANLIARKYNKTLLFKDNKKISYLIADIKLLSKFYVFKKSKKLKELIF